MLFIIAAPIARLVKKLVVGASIVTEAIPLVRSTSPASPSRTNSGNVITTTEEASEVGGPRSSAAARVLESVGRGSILHADGMLDLTQTEMDSVVPPLPVTEEGEEEDPEERLQREDYHGDRGAQPSYGDDADEEPAEPEPSQQPTADTKSSKHPARRSVSAQRAKRGLSRSNGTKVKTTSEDTHPVSASRQETTTSPAPVRSELASLRVLKTASADADGDTHDATDARAQQRSYFVDNGEAESLAAAPSAASGNNALARAAVRRASRQGMSPLHGTSEAAQPSLPPPPPMAPENALKASQRRRSKTSTAAEHTGPVPMQVPPLSGAQPLPPPPPPPSTSGTASQDAGKPPHPSPGSSPEDRPGSQKVAPPPPPVNPRTGSVTSLTGANISPSDILKSYKSYSKSKLQSLQDYLEDDDEQATAATAAAAPSNPKLARAKRMKSLYVAVSKRPARLTDTEVTPFGKVKKVKKRAESDMELEMFRASTLSADGNPSHDSGEEDTAHEGGYRDSEYQDMLDNMDIDGEGDAEGETEHDQHRVDEHDDFGMRPPSRSDDGDECNEAAADDAESGEDQNDDQGPLANNKVSWGAKGARPASTNKNASEGVSPVPSETFVPVSSRRRAGTQGSQVDDAGEEGEDGARDNDDGSETRSTSSTSLNALERSAERRRSRSASPSAIASRRASKRDSNRARSSSASALLQRTSSGNFLDMFTSAKYVEEAGVMSAYDLIISNTRQPLVRRLFDNYCKSDQTLDVPLVQQLCYDMSIYYSHLDIRVGIKPFVHSSQPVMNYDSFMVWWRSNNDFRYVTGLPQRLYYYSERCDVL
jgi:hypothetical protein